MFICTGLKVISCHVNLASTKDSGKGHGTGTQGKQHLLRRKTPQETRIQEVVLFLVLISSLSLPIWYMALLQQRHLITVWSLIGRRWSVKMSSASGTFVSDGNSSYDLASQAESGTILDLEYITKNIEDVSNRISAAVSGRSEEVRKSAAPHVRLVAVSKLKPISNIIKAYSSGHRHFGENYIQELITKAQVLEKECLDIRWHFIGHLQSNKIGKLVSIGAQLSVVETVDSQRIAGVLNAQREKWVEADPKQRRGLDPLGVMVQVNTSGEEGKGGTVPNAVDEVVGFIVSDCPFLRFQGLMTIGRDYETPEKPNPDFVLLVKVKDSLCKIFKWEPKDIELSMGMSADYEEAIELGASNVRIGSTVFGERK